jgi:hypothetical protein
MSMTFYFPGESVTGAMHATDYYRFDRITNNLLIEVTLALLMSSDSFGSCHVLCPSCASSGFPLSMHVW